MHSHSTSFHWCSDAHWAASKHYIYPAGWKIGWNDFFSKATKMLELTQKLGMSEKLQLYRQYAIYCLIHFTAIRSKCVLHPTLSLAFHCVTAIQVTIRSAFHTWSLDSRDKTQPTFHCIDAMSILMRPFKSVSLPFSFCINRFIRLLFDLHRRGPGSHTFTRQSD